MKFRIFIATLVLIFTQQSFGLDFTVNTFADLVDDSPGDGNCEATEQTFNCTLRAAIMESNANVGVDTIYLPAGVFTLSIAGVDNDAFSGDLDITEEVHIVGAGMNLTVIDGAGIDRIFQFIGVSGSVSNLTLQNGGDATATDHGGAIVTQGGTATIVEIYNVMFDNNRANSGGAVSFLNGSGKINNSIFVNNYTVALALNQFGSAIDCFYCDFTLGSTVIANNYDAFNAVFIDEGTGIFFNSTISNNSGVGVNAQNSDALFWFTTFYMNAQGNLSLYSFDDTNTFDIGNSAFKSNGLDNCISTGVPFSSGYNVIDDDSCGLAVTGDMENTDPMLEPLADNGGHTLTHLPASESPLIDHIPLADCHDYLINPMDRDQRGFLRPIGDSCDVGAVERDLIFKSGYEM